MSKMYLKEIEFKTASEEELKEFTDNARANVLCGRELKKAIGECHDGYHLDTAKVIQKVQETNENFTPERIAYCLATGIGEMKHDGRISRENREWAETIRENLPEQYKDSRNHAVSSITSNLESAHMALVDAVASEFRREFPEITSLEHGEPQAKQEKCTAELYLKSVDTSDKAQIESYVESTLANEACAGAIHKAISDNYSVESWSLNTEKAMEDVLKQYEPERVAFVLSAALHTVDFGNETDGRLNRDVMEWTREICSTVPEQYLNDDSALTMAGEIFKSNHGLVNMMAKEFRKEFPEITSLELFTEQAEQGKNEKSAERVK